MQEEPSILASLGIDPAASPAPPDDVWSAALQAAFDPSATADPDTVPEMDDEPPTLAANDEIIVEPAVLEGTHDGGESGSVSDHDVVAAEPALGDPDLSGPTSSDPTLEDPALDDNAATGPADHSGAESHDDGAGPHDGHYDL
ncbi:MAG: hypothetical protein CME34_18220 [Gordonia sp.]|uniref:hypothetical protein n=1 Tax=Gordonia sp. (in: high G+C Gram-positive bacteria) TaxID=84139 RepID=UPI000C59D7E2|nr:hypothetical protein [Gordonia sp. (in: high G+C Gram-positive bacteria)]MAU83765.1 hypothetical protein [Gordonia sp. (in: high G+C Gram-positive bacteria)]